ncbi:hypothetical protein M0805_003045 [Coniferiporia weirii]|nr:hypothetical protein M0805_003045 [Coniferiporia weirii]
MAALQLPQKPGERISQILPTVKCSSCGRPVALSDLGDHVCPPPPPSTPRPSALLAKIRQASQSISIPNPLNTQRTPSPSPRAQTPVVARSKTPQPAPPLPSMPPVAAPLPRQATPGARSQIPSMIRTQTPQQPPPQMPPPPTPRTPGPPARFDAPSRAGTPQMPPQTPRSAVSRFDTLPRSAASSVHADRLSRHATDGTRRPSVSSAMDDGPSRMRVPSAPERPNIPTTAPRTSVNLGPMSRSPPGPMPSRPSMDAPSRLSIDRPGSTRPSMDGNRVMSPLGPSASRTPTVPTGRPGGDQAADVVNMAGVGRRGFQAAAQAAMLAAGLNKNQPQDRMHMMPSGMDGRRTNAPRQLNINADIALHQGSTSLSPNTPLSSHSPHSPTPNSPNAFPQPGIASSRTPSPIGIGVPFAALPQAILPKSPDTVGPGSTRSVTPQGSRFSARFNSKELQINTVKAAPQDEAPISPTDSDYSSGGLAYDQDTESVASPASPPTSLPTSNTISPAERILFPSSGSPPRPVNGLPARSTSSASSYSYASRSTARSTGALGLDRALDTLFEDSRSPPLPAMPISPPMKSPKLPTRSRTTPAMSSTKSGSTDTGATRNRPRQCTRCSKTIDDGRWVRAEGAGVLCERCWKTMYLPKCRRCNRPIEKQAVSSADGQLKGKYHRECFNCYKCQQPFPDKEFYVFDGQPYCRYHYHEANDSLCADPSCGQPIEGACAVAHTGERYHPEHLLCEYLLPASGAGRGGTRQRCNERLEEYWEVDGRMLCEKHANMVNPAIEDDDEDEDDEDDIYPGLGVPELRTSKRLSDADARAHRRKTMFIDLR